MGNHPAAVRETHASAENHWPSFFPPTPSEVSAGDSSVTAVGVVAPTRREAGGPFHTAACPGSLLRRCPSRCGGRAFVCPANRQKGGGFWGSAQHRGRRSGDDLRDGKPSPVRRESHQTSNGWRAPVCASTCINQSLMRLYRNQRGTWHGVVQLAAYIRSPSRDGSAELALAAGQTAFLTILHDSMSKPDPGI